MIAINQVAIPTPSDLTVSIMDISKAERNAAGTMVIERIATKRKLELSYAYLSKEQAQQVLTAVSAVTFTVTYIDPQTGATRTITCYAGDRSAGFLDVKNGIPRYRDVKFNLIEK